MNLAQNRARDSVRLGGKPEATVEGTFVESGFLFLILLLGPFPGFGPAGSYGLAGQFPSLTWLPAYTSAIDRPTHVPSHQTRSGLVL